MRLRVRNCPDLSAKDRALASASACLSNSARASVLYRLRRGASVGVAASAATRTGDLEPVTVGRFEKQAGTGVPLTAGAMRALAAQRDIQTFQKDKAGELWQAADRWDESWPRDLVFTRADGSPLDLTGVTKAFKKVLAKAEIERPELHFHSSRHTVGSLVYQATHDLKIAGAMLGHKQAATTAKYYADTSEEATRGAADAYGLALERARVGGSR